MPYKNPEDKKRYALLHREERKEYWKKYAESNKEHRLANAKRYCLENRQKISELGKLHYRNNKDKISKRHREYYEKTREQYLERGRVYRKNNPERSTQRYIRIRDAKLGAINSLTFTQIKEMKKCGCFFADGTCRGFLSVAHDVPFSKGGHTNRANTFILCKRHNSMMGTKQLKDILVQLPLPFMDGI